jgi:hypothetical protein
MMVTRRRRLSGVDDIAGRAPRIGKLKIGEVLEKRRPDGSVATYPSKLDHIVAKDGAGNLIGSFHEVYGERPVAFMAVFPSNDPVDFYWEAYRRYGSGSGLVCHGDGREAIVEGTGEAIECPCPFAEPTVDGDGRERAAVCKAVASCSLWLYEVPELGVFQIDTSSFRSISNLKWFIRTGLPSLSGGQIAGIPFRVFVEPFQAVHDGKASIAYQWKFGLAPGMKPADVRVAAQEAVEGFCLPVEVGPRMIDEAKPEDLYPGLPAPSAPADGVVQEDLPPDVDERELRYLAALEATGWAKGKQAAAISTMEFNRGQALELQNFDGYRAWLGQTIARLPKAAA